jgi:tetratricopeptide (TPR) repeat protein
MNKKRKTILSITGLVFLLALSIFAVTFFLDSPLRKKLPEHPPYNTLSKSLQEQIKFAALKSYLHPTAGNIGNLGMVYHSGVFYDNALLCYQMAAEISRRDWIWSYYLGYLNLELGDAKASIENFRHVTERNPRNYMALFYTGQAYQNLGMISNSEDIYKRIASSKDCDPGGNKMNRESYFPLQTYAMFNLARIYTDSKRFDSAETVLKEIIKKQWTFGPAYRLLGNVYIKKGDSVLSKKFITRANDLNEYNPPPDTLIDKIALISRSDQYLLKQIDDAKMSYNFIWEYKLCTSALNNLPDNKYLLSNTIVLDFILGRNKEVLPLLDRHFKGYSDDFEEMMKMAQLLYGKGFQSQAMMYFNQAKKLQPGASRLALWLMSVGKKNEAVNLIDDQLKKEPKNERTLTDAVHIYLNLGDKEKAKTLLTRLKQLYPQSIEAKKATGLLLEMDGNLKEALIIYEDITKSGQKDLSIIKYQASLYLRDKMWDKAILVFRQGLESFPNEPELLEPLGRLLISCPDTKLRDINEGKEYSERAYIHYKCPPETRIAAARNLATAFAMLGDKKMASMYINITLDMVSKGKVPPQDFTSYFQALKKQYNISN